MQFKSADKIKNATPADLAAVIGEAKAKLIIDYFEKS
jgi:hypothetical protein